MKKSGFVGIITGAISSIYNKFKDKSTCLNFENLFNPNFKELHEITVKKIIEDLQDYDNPPF
jgi:hypothetical protein